MTAKELIDALSQIVEEIGPNVVVMKTHEGYATGKTFYSDIEFVTTCTHSGTRVIEL